MAKKERVSAGGLQFIKSEGSITPVAISRYIEEFGVTLHPAQRALIEATMKHPRAEMMGDIAQLSWFGWLLRSMNAKNVVEVGVFTGCSALAAALALPAEGRVYALDICEEYFNIGKPFFKQAAVEDKIQLKIGPAIESLDLLIEELGQNSVDFVFIDAVKLEYLEYYERSLKLLRRGGVIAFDNMLQSGRVVNPRPEDENAKFCVLITEKLRDDHRIDFSIIPIGDGVALARKL